MSAENKAVTRRIYEDVWNPDNLDVADEIFASAEGVKRYIAVFRVAFPDIRQTDTTRPLSRSTGGPDNTLALASDRNRSPARLGRETFSHRGHITRLALRRANRAPARRSSRRS